jgi:hypothetical protein
MGSQLTPLKRSISAHKSAKNDIKRAKAAKTACLNGLQLANNAPQWDHTFTIERLKPIKVISPWRFQTTPWEHFPKVTLALVSICN